MKAPTSHCAVAVDGRCVACEWRNAGCWATTRWQRTRDYRYDGGEAGDRGVFFGAVGAASYADAAGGGCEADFPAQ